MPTRRTANHSQSAYYPRFHPLSRVIAQLYLCRYGGTCTGSRPTRCSGTPHSITWTTVGHWLDLWTTPDRRRAIRVNRDRADAWEHPDERLAPPVCFDSKATGAACERRNDRLYGTRQIDVVRRYDTELDQLIGSYLTARQPSLF